MRKKKVLFITEFSELHTGYAVYAKEVLSRLYKRDDIEVAEMACYLNDGNPKAANVPWKLYSVPWSDEKARTESSYNQFGAGLIDSVCLDFKPDIVCTYRDHWMDQFVKDASFRHIFKWVWMPTIDSLNQHEQWLETYADADAILTYTDWSGRVLQEESGNHINWFGSASPCASPDFHPLENNIKQQIGLGNYKIVGTVMRNQRRKLYPDLFCAFREFLNKTKRNDILLYCHTAYPDSGWDIPRILIEYGLSSKVLFTYKCANCGHAYPQFFSDAISTCQKCKQYTAQLPNTNFGLDNNTMNAVFNIMDLYLQYSISEGFGMPQVEAAAAGVPVMAVDFSAMSEVTDKLNGYKIPLSGYFHELETGTIRAVPDDNALIAKLEEFFSLSYKERLDKGLETRELYLKNYSWDSTADKWAEVFGKLDFADWSVPPQIFEPARKVPENLNNAQFARWLVENVMGDRRKIGSYLELRLTRDLNYNSTEENLAGHYLNDESYMHHKPTFQEFNREIAYNHLYTLRMNKNKMEEIRCG